MMCANPAFCLHFGAVLRRPVFLITTAPVHGLDNIDAELIHWMHPGSTVSPQVGRGCDGPRRFIEQKADSRFDTEFAQHLPKSCAPVSIVSPFNTPFGSGIQPLSVCLPYGGLAEWFNASGLNPEGPRIKRFREFESHTLLTPSSPLSSTPRLNCRRGDFSGVMHG